MQRNNKNPDYKKANIMDSTSIRTQLVAIQSNLLNFAYMLTSNRDDAYDLLQDTTLKVLSNTGMYTENTNFKGWVFTIMRNIFINNYHKVIRSANVIDRTEDLYKLDLPQESGFETPEGTVSASEITDAINAFPDEYRLPFTLMVTGYKYSEIAEKLDIPVGTVKSRIFFVRRQLQETLKDYVN